ncbi:unnamed protein product [Bemisia tabaci]|uniref:Uncharacterized protein n=1 Tax=Bemisia tabaci TaxID=7038 RepID=A0A9P0AM74_BEMTA|nr:unnamed protein product [Bemisia tabaci]
MKLPQAGFLLFLLYQRAQFARGFGPNPKPSFSLDLDHGHRSDPRNLIRTLNDLIAYYKSHPQKVDVNLLFGFAIVAGQLEIIQESIPQGSSWHTQIQKLRNDLTQFREETVCLGCPLFNYIYDYLNVISPMTWTFSEGYKWLKFRDFPTRLPRQRYDETLNRNASDFCLQRISEECNASEECIAMELNPSSTGYALTHQILFLILAKQFGCEIKFKGEILDAEDIIQRKCTHAFVEAHDLYRKSVFRDPVACDLFIEQIAVCGLMNIVDFFEIRRWFEFILSLQTPEGYFTCSNYHTNVPRDFLEAARNHVSSVSAVAIVLDLKHSLLRSIALE